MNNLIDAASVNFYFDLYITLLAGLIFSFSGVLTNIVNIVVYYKSGIKDSVTVTFVALSLWEMSFSLLNMIGSICDIMGRYFPVESVDILLVGILYCFYPMGLFHSVANIVTVYLSTERFMCVLIPLKVKGLFTKSGSIYLNISFLLICTVCIAPMWTTQGLQWGFDPTVNRTRWVMWMTENRLEVSSFSLYFYTVVMPPLTQIIIMIESIFMVYAARVQSRLSATSLTASGNSASGVSRRRKESRMTKLVIWKNVIFMIHYFPWFLRCMEDIAPESDVVKNNKDLLKAFGNGGRVMSLLNVNSNFFLYYIFSTKYKKVFLSMFYSIKKKELGR